MKGEPLKTSISDQSDANTMDEGSITDFQMSEQLHLRAKEKTRKKTSYESWHETSETELAFTGDHGESDDSVEPVRKMDEDDLLDKIVEHETSDEHKEGEKMTLRQRIYRARHLCGKIVNNTYVQWFIIMLIVVNAIMMGIATFDFIKDDPDKKRAFERTDKAFLIIFTVEIVMQIIYHGYYLFTDAWLVFDLVIVVISWAFSSMQIIRSFRVFRALRLITRVETMRKLVVALFSVMPRMGAISALLFLVFYIYAVLCTVLFKDLWENGQTDEDYFSRLDYSLYTLFQIMTLEDWGNVARQTMEVYNWAWIVFVSYVAVTAFIVYNLIIAVVCDAVAVIEHESNEEEGQDMYHLEAKYKKEISDLNERMNNLAQQQQLLLSGLRNSLQELESFGEKVS